MFWLCGPIQWILWIIFISTQSDWLAKHWKKKQKKNVSESNEITKSIIILRKTNFSFHSKKSKKKKKETKYSIEKKTFHAADLNTIETLALICYLKKLFFFVIFRLEFRLSFLSYSIIFKLYFFLVRNNCWMIMRKTTAVRISFMIIVNLEGCMAHF